MNIFGKSILGSMNREIEYNGDLIVQFGEEDFTAFAYADEDCEEIIEKNFHSLIDAKAWLDACMLNRIGCYD